MKAVSPIGSTEIGPPFAANFSPSLLGGNPVRCKQGMAVRKLLQNRSRGDARVGVEREQYPLRGVNPLESRKIVGDTYMFVLACRNAVVPACPGRLSLREPAFVIMEDGPVLLIGYRRKNRHFSFIRVGQHLERGIGVSCHHDSVEVLGFVSNRLDFYFI